MELKFDVAGPIDAHFVQHTRFKLVGVNMICTNVGQQFNREPIVLHLDRLDLLLSLCLREDLERKAVVLVSSVSEPVLLQ